jgi:hypothetical protein
MEEMNWFLLTLPVTILYESRGMPKSAPEPPDSSGAVAKLSAPDTGAKAELSETETCASGFSPPVLSEAEVPASALPAADFAAATAVDPGSAVEDLLQDDTEIRMAARKASPVTGNLI